MTLIDKIKGFFTAAVLSVAMVNVFVGTLNGYIIGYVGVYDTLHRGNENCTQLTTQEACGSVSFTKCRWEASQCIFTDEPACGLQSGEDNCKARKACFFDYESGTCLHKTGWDSVLLGVFAAAMTLGGMIGSFSSGPLVRLLGCRWPIFGSGSLALLATIILHIGRATDIYALAIVGRILVGAAMGMCSVAAPMYVEQHSPADYKAVLGAFYQIFTCLGLLIVAAVGLGLEPTNFKEKQINAVSIPMFIFFQYVFSIILIVMAFFLKNSSAASSEEQKPQDVEPNEPITAAEAPEEKAKTHEEQTSREYSFTRMIPQLLVAAVTCVAFQFTGINAIMNYAPSITKSMGLRPLMGNFLVMLWNFISSLILIPIAPHFSNRALFLFGVAGAFVSQFLAAIVIYPGVVGDDKARAGISGLGIFAFIFFFEFGIGPAFFVLVIKLFPESFRSRGAGFAGVLQYLFNIIINVCFPIAVVEISGGPSGNQNKGMSAVFFFFSGCAVITVVFLYFKLFPFGEKSDSQGGGEVSTEKNNENNNDTNDNNNH